MMQQRATPSPEAAAFPWWHEFFDDAYAAYGLAAGDPADDAQRVDFLARTLELKPGDAVFDQCCGVGRISIPLAERAFHVIGVDRVQTYIAAARREAASRGLTNCEFHCADAFEFVAPEPCDAAINWFTSFGYCEDDAINARMFQRVHDSLKPGGRAIFEYQNIPRIMGDFQASLVSRPQASGAEGMIVLQENKPDFIRGMMQGKWTVIYPDGRRREHEIQTRLYMPHEIVKLLRGCGFDGFTLLGGRDGAAYSRTSPRLIVFCQR